MGWIDKLAWFRFLGLQTTFEMVRYALRRDGQEALRGRRAQEHPYYLPGDLNQIRVIEGGAIVEFEHSTLRLETLRPGALRVEWETGSPPFAYPALTPDREYDPPLIEPTSTGYSLSFSSLKVEVSVKGSVSFLAPDDVVLRREQPPLLSRTGWRARAALVEGASVHGLGERAAPLNLRGGSYRMWNRDPDGEYGPGDDPIYICIPVYLCLQTPGAYLIHYENSHDGSLAFDESAAAEMAGGGLVYAFIRGDLEGIYRTYSDLVGRPPLPPRWALGYHQSRFSYMNSEEVRRIARDFERHDLPLSAIHLDIDAMHGYRVFTFDPARYGDIESLSAEMEAAGVKLVSIIDPGVKRDPDYERFDDGMAHNTFLKRLDGKPLVAPVWPGAAVFPDFTDQSTRSWWGHGYRKMLEHGIAGFWHDMNEPAAFAAWGANTLPRTTPHAMEGRGGTHLEAHNLYGLLMNRAAFEGLRELEPEKRPWMLTRSGWAGVQKYAWTWTGDTLSSWEVLRGTIPTVLGLSLSGIPYGGPDIGGFTGSPSAELFLRWFQLAAFLPFFRTHSSSGTPRREPWAFGEPALSHLRTALKLRERMMPYWYTLAWQASQDGLPIVRPLFWADPTDARLQAVEDAFLLGDDLLIAPAIFPGQTRRELVLPAGRWFDIQTGERYDGPDTVNLPAPLERCPALARAGALIPMQEGENLILEVFAPEMSQAMRLLYDDGGDGYGASRLDRFTLVRERETLEIFWEKDGAYPFPYDSVKLSVHGFEPDSVVVDGEPVEAQDQPWFFPPFSSVRMRANS